MGHEISQFDIPYSSLSMADASTRERVKQDLGVAKITQTIFGKARVRIIREQDKKRRAGLLITLAATVMAIAAWQGWVAISQPSAPPASVKVRVSTPAEPAASHPAAEKLHPGSAPSGIPQPLTPQPLSASQQRSAPVANTNAAPRPPEKLQTVVSKPATLDKTIRPPAPGAATPPAPRRVTNTPAAFATPVEPPIAQDAENPVPADNSQAPDPGSIAP